MLSKEHRNLLRTEIGRKFLIDKTLEAVPKDKNWQNFHTPYDLCEKMISKTDVSNKSILVLFNIEFIETLIYKFGVSSKSILFIADCRIESEMAAKIYKVDNIIVNDIDELQEVLKGMKKFDLCFSNPPYTGSSDVDIIKSILPICTEIIVVHPAAWLLDNKCLKKSYFTKYREEIKNYCESAYIFDGNAAFNITGPCSPFTIFKINKGHNKKISVNYFDEQQFDVDSVYDITVFGNDWISIVKPFFNVINDYLNNNNNIWDWEHRIIKTIHENKYYCQFRSQEPGSPDKSGRYMYGKDFYSIIQKNTLSERYKINYDDIDLTDKRIKFWFNTEIERNNFIEYLKTNFVRFCISIFKTNENLHRRELCLIPVMDFAQEWTDEKLYEFFNIPQETIDYITNFFPDDIYGLRNRT